MIAHDKAATVARPPLRVGSFCSGYGHITCGELVFCDMGSVLSAWSYCGDNIEPERARALGLALIAWADRKQGESDA